MVRLCRDPWVPWTVFSPFRAIGPDRSVTADVTPVPAPPSPARPVYRVSLWVRGDDGTIRSVPLVSDR
jgi:hypothetical protein